MTILTEEHVEKMRQLAIRAHISQDRSDGQPYYNGHVKPVHDQLPPALIRARVLAYGHDIIEDHPEWTPDIESGFPPDVVAGLGFLTKMKGESYYHFIHRIISSGDLDVILTKISDVFHNASDFKPLMAKSFDRARQDKYLLALDLLVSVYRSRGWPWPLVLAVEEFLRKNRQ